ncbi:hypothetical protein PEX2_070020 [Penicillium expansum]|uniref:Uncharacterized protein n=1 Tax=Penicillium expansum TaxID=27334 RepID=A0A0A2JUI8_PENEN|nr:hypothetical protein PEX2_070020 [Penicillium expansum]KGO58501.1 hypothetical protein PEX2_070020 [Penicillium expansum]
MPDTMVIRYQSASAQTPPLLPAPEPTPGRVLRDGSSAGPQSSNNPVRLATIRCLHDQHPTLEEETMVRSLHPALKHCDCVSVVEGGPVRKPVWLVNARGAQNINNTHAAGREIHVLPAQTLPPVSPLGLLMRPVNIERINPRSFLEPQKVTLIREAFPGSIGAQILITGWLLILFPEKKSLKTCWDKGVTDEVGGLRVGYIIASFHATANIVESGRAVSSAPGTLAQQAALGLRLRLPGGQEAITTVTHAFVRLADSRMSRIRKRFTEYILTAKDYLKRIQPPPRQVPQANDMYCRGRR